MQKLINHNVCVYNSEFKVSHMQSYRSSILGAGMISNFMPASPLTLWEAGWEHWKSQSHDYSSVAGSLKFQLHRSEWSWILYAFFKLAGLRSFIQKLLCYPALFGIIKDKQAGEF